MDCATQLHKGIVEEFGKHDLTVLTSSKNWVQLPDPVRPGETYGYMGRALTKEIREFVLSIGFLRGFEDLRENKSDDFHKSERTVIGFVSGVPGYGKSTSLKTAFGNLYHFFLPSSQAKLSLDSNIPRAAVDEFAEKQKKLEVLCDGFLRPIRAPSKRKRIMFIDSRAFVLDPSEAIAEALLLSHYDMAATDSLLVSLAEKPDAKGIISFLQSGMQEEEVYVLFDDGNFMDPDDDEISFSKDQRQDAWNFLERLSRCCAIVVCASAKSWVVKSLGTDKGYPHKLYGGGFTISETSDYLSHRNIVLSRHDKDVTGCVPRLIKYVRGPTQLRSSYKWYEDGIQAFITKYIKGGRGDEIYRMLSGTEQVEELFDGLETGCFYRGPNGTAECLTNHLKSYALGCLARQMKALGVLNAKQEMQRWLSTVPADTNMCRIGWNAEAAGIIAFSLLDVAIDITFLRQTEENEISVPEVLMLQIHQALMKDGSSWSFSKPLGDVLTNLNSGKYAASGDAFANDVKRIFDDAIKCTKGKPLSAARRMKDRFVKLWHEAEAEAVPRDILKFEPEEVRHFSGEFVWAPWNGKKRMHVPYAFNHRGARLYYEDESSIVVIQFSVARNAKKKHPRTIELMKSFPPSERRRRILLWVLGGAGWVYERVEDGNMSYEDVEIPFGDVRHELGCIDSRCSMLRMSPGEECLYCCRGDCPTKNVDNWVQCGECDLWVHKLCIDHKMPGGSFVCLDCQPTTSKTDSFDD